MHPSFHPIHDTPTQASNLDRSLVRNWRDGLGSVVFHRNGAGLSGHEGLSLQVDVGSVGLGLLLEFGVGLDTADELFSRAGKGDVLDSEVDALLDVAVLDFLVDDDTDGRLGDVVDNTGLSVVNLVWHTLLDSTVCLDINDVSNFVLTQVCAQFDHTLLLEVSGEGIPSTCAETCWMTHCYCSL